MDELPLDDHRGTSDHLIELGVLDDGDEVGAPHRLHEVELF